jgi:hypothetical protein
MNIKRGVILLLAVFTFITAISPIQAQAFVQASETSAAFAAPQATPLPVVKQDNRAAILRSYLQQYNSPLADHADTFIKEADANNIDWRMVVAISGVESTFGEAIPPYSYNAWGYNVYGTNVRSFASWDDGITVVSTDLRQIYMNQRGATNVYQIGATYAASPTWAARVQGYMDDISQYSARVDKPTLSISL